MPESMSHSSMTYTPTYYQNRDRGQIFSPYRASNGQQIQEASPPLPATQAVQSVSYLTEKYHVSQESFNHGHNPHSPISTASYSQNVSFAGQAPVQIPSPTYSQGSRAEQGYYGRDVSSRSGIMVDEYGSTSMTSAVRNSPNFIFSGHEDVESVDEATSSHAIWLMTWLSCLSPLFSFFCAFYSLLSLLAILLFSPLQLCGLTRSVPTNIERYVSPLWRIQLRVVYSQKLQQDHDMRANPAMLLIVQLTAPILGLGVALAAWVAASFWLFALIMGNPDGTERGDDGRNTVILVRDWWEKWLLRAAR